jgi:uncharacterized protein YkwD
MKKIAIGIIVVGLLFGTSIANASPRSSLLRSTNRIRQHHNLQRLALDRPLSQQALIHSQEMADRGELFHTADLAGVLGDRNWSVAGENVGTGASVRAIQRAFLKSPPHRANILLKNYKHVGIGVYQDSSGIYWVTVIFWG